MWIVVVVLIIAGAFIWWQGTQNNASVPTPTVDAIVPAEVAPTSVTDASTTPVAAPQSVVVEYTAAGFSPSPIVVAKGGTVTFVNKSANKMWVATGPHPAHTGYDGDETLRLSLDGIGGNVRPRDDRCDESFCCC